MADFVKADDGVDRYVREINTYPLLTRPGEFALAVKYREQSDMEAAHQLVVSNLRFVVKVAHEYRGYGLRLLDLIQEGNMGLMIAVQKFEPKKGYRLISYAVWWIRAYIQNFIMRTWSLVKVGTTQAQRKLFFKLRSERERADREAGPGSVASVEELAKRLAVHDHDITDMEMRLGVRDFSLDVEMQDGSKQNHLELLANPDWVPSQEETYAQDEEQQLLRRRVREALDVLNEKERYIVVNRLMADEPQTLQQIGKHFAISRERARQIEGNVIRKIRAMLTLHHFAPAAA